MERVKVDQRESEDEWGGGWGGVGGMEGGQSAPKEGRWRSHGETVIENKREYLREIWLHMSASSARRQHCVKITCPIMKRDCSPFLSGMLYCRRTPRLIHPLSPHIHISCIYLDAVIYCL